MYKVDITTKLKLLLNNFFSQKINFKILRNYCIIKKIIKGQYESCDVLSLEPIDHFEKKYIQGELHYNSKTTFSKYNFLLKYSWHIPHITTDLFPKKT
jgi:hypothetical protein